MSKESYMRGFCKAAEAAGVDPVKLIKFAQDGVVDEQYAAGQQALAERRQALMEDLANIRASAGGPRYATSQATAYGRATGVAPAAYRALEDHYRGLGYDVGVDVDKGATNSDVVLSKGGKPAMRFRYSEGAKNPWVRMNLSGQGRYRSFDDEYSRLAAKAKSMGGRIGRYGDKVMFTDKNGNTHWAQFDSNAGKFSRVAAPTSVAMASRLSAGRTAIPSAARAAPTAVASSAPAAKTYRTKSEEMMANIAAGHPERNRPAAPQGAVAAGDVAARRRRSGNPPMDIPGPMVASARR